MKRFVYWNQGFCAWVGLALILAPSCSALAAGEGTITVTDAAEGTNSVEFSFISTWPPGTSYQPQFLRQIGAVWADLPDARVEEVDEAPGLFQVTAPRFGGDSGFYRVLNSVSLPTDPAQNSLNEPNPDELMLFWNQPGTSTNRIRGKVFYQPTESGGTNFLTFPATVFGSTSPVAASGAQDVLMSDLDGDGRVEPLMVWVNAANQIVISVTEVVATNLNWTVRTTFPPLPGVSVRPPATVPPLVRVLRAHLGDSDPPRLWLGYSGADGFAHVALLEMNQELTTIRVVSQVADARLPYEAGSTSRARSTRFDLAAGDFDGDGFDEVALLVPEAFTVAGGISNWRLRARFYDFDPALNRFIPDTVAGLDNVLFAHDNRESRWLSRVAGLAADFDGDNRAELAVAYHVGVSDQQSPWYLQFVKPAANLASIGKFPAQGQQVDRAGFDEDGYPLDLHAGEFDGDPLPELVYGSRMLMLFNVQSNLSFSSLTLESINSERDSADRRFITLANLDASDPATGFRPEIVVVTDQFFNEGAQRRLTVKSLKVTGGGTNRFRLLNGAILNDEISNNSQRFFALGSADFRRNPTLGTPRRYTRTVSGKPVVIVNAPPIHFDVINGVSYDVNRMFPLTDCIDDGCPFYSRYTVQNTTSIKVETDWKRGWNVGAKVKGGVELPLGVGLKAEIETKFGERFNSFASSNTTTTVQVQVDAVAEDRIYAATIDYTIWEYPVLVNGAVVSHILAYAPEVERPNWFGSKSIVAQNYRPYHEVGNLLSYRATTEPYPGADFVRTLENADTFTVDDASYYVWQLTRTAASTTRESRTFNFSIKGQASFDIPVPWIPDVELSGGYDSSALKSSTTELTDQQGLSAKLGALDGDIAGTDYSITPYFYWDRSGALVLDYAVALSTGTAGQPTFWGQQYSSKADPAFILPWRLDPEKGQAVLNEAQRQLTREIATVPSEPRPGQEVDLVARISNFSFRETSPNSFKVRFYLGDPATDGQLLANRNGESSLSVRTGIPGRGKEIVHFPWKVPESAASASILIYCVIDPDNQLDEIHENNNVGWNEIFIRNQP